ncbi:hypothetical protein AB0323_08935 [Arthrobacter sp. NPDC080031]|uniref:hypothetical protein n=1 Tax=Arthrobacter sp. NPDC080031 TaxID=3155918 RepID=UPI00344B46B1
MKEYVLPLGIAGLALALAGCGGSPQAAPTVTITQTITATQTVTAPAPTVTVTQTVAPVAAPAPAPAAPAVATAVLPADAAGQNAQALSDELQALGFKHVVWNSDTGNSVFLLSNWTVTSLEKAGESVPLSKTIVAHVTKPGQ